MYTLNGVADIIRPHVVFLSVIVVPARWGAYTLAAPPALDVRISVGENRVLFR